MGEPAAVTALTNFGGNVQFHPSEIHAPRSEEELLAFLDTRRGKRVRAIGRLHSWSDAAIGEEVVIDTTQLNRVTIHDAGEDSWVEVEAGCQIKHLLTELARQGGFTMPTLGLITEQTIVGAASTGTHGSGRHSLSHYIQAIRLVSFDVDTGSPQVRVIDSGEELRAARCAIGCLGIVTSVRLPIRKQYRIEEHFYRYNSLAEVLQQEIEFPLQQFFLVPWRWDYFAQQRRESDRPRSQLAWLYRLYWGVGMDIVFHVVVNLLARVLPSFATKVFYRWIMPTLIPQGWRVVDRSDRQLTMEHELFRHIEIEVFVTRGQVAAALDYVVWTLKHFGGEQAELPEHLRGQLQQAGKWSEIDQLKGTYLHHYPVCIRKVLADDTLISMASGTGEPYYALSFISYVHPSRRNGFGQFAAFLASTMATLFNARPHWGKFCPLPPQELRQLYPHFDQFAAICKQSGSTTAFTNAWLTKVLEQ